MKFILGILVGIALVCAAVYVYFGFGFAPVATSAPAMPFEKRLARWALSARIEKEMPRTAPLAADGPNLVAGAHLYTQWCAVCHGLPDQPSALREAMYPRPPQLFQGKGVTDDRAGETYWKTANGIRMTGMPAFDRLVTDREIWQVSLLLANADKLPPDVHSALATAQVPK